MNDISAEESLETPYWRVLDLLQYMPCEMTDPIIPELLEIIELDNPSWSDEAIVKAFELVNFMVPSDKQKNFVWRLCSSPKERLSKNAKRWKEWIEVDESEDEDQ